MPISVNRSPFPARGRVTRLFAWVLAAFFVIGALGNIFPPASVVHDYDAWGYPTWFHYVTGGLELLTAVLLAKEATRLAGALLGSGVMAAALVTLLLHGEWLHALPPLVVLAALALLGAAAWRRRRNG